MPGNICARMTRVLWTTLDNDCMNYRVLNVAVLATSLCTVSVHAEEGWTFSLTPYLWLPTIKGEMAFSIPSGGSGSPNLETGPSDYLSDLNFGFMLSGEARKGTWSLFGDLIYLDIAGAKTNTVSVNLPGGGSVPVVDTGSETSVSGTLLTLAPGYRLYSSARGNMDLFGGLRYMRVKADVDWRISGPVGAFPATGAIEEDQHITDGIIGIRGRIRPASGKWSLPYYLDLGTGSSDFTWQAFLGASYSYSWGDITLAYRQLKFDLGSHDLVNDLTFKGPMLGASFHF